MHLRNALNILTFLLIRKKTVGLDHVITPGFPIGMPMAEPGDAWDNHWLRSVGSIHSVDDMIRSYGSP